MTVKKEMLGSSTLPQLHRGESFIFLGKDLNLENYSLYVSEYAGSELFCYTCKNIEGLMLCLSFSSV